LSFSFLFEKDEYVIPLEKWRLLLLSDRISRTAP